MGEEIPTSEDIQLPPNASGLRSVGVNRFWPVWWEFSSRHARHPFLEHESLVALTRGQIKEIKERIPTFFTPEEEAFEEDLAFSAPMGFFRQHAIEFREQRRVPDSEGKGQATFRGFYDLAGNEWERKLQRTVGRGFHHDQIDPVIVGVKAMLEAFSDRYRAYLGWLVLQQGFWDDLRGLGDHHDWPGDVRGQLPAFHPLFPLRHDEPFVEREQNRPFLAFLVKWCLDGMNTWEWPRPLGIGVQETALAPHLRRAGVTAFAPYYLSRDGSVDFSALISRARFEERPHLEDWFKRSGDRSRAGGAGQAMLRMVAYVYRHLYLGLFSRYRDRCWRRLGKLDAAFAAAITLGPSVSPQSVGDAREMIARTLPRWFPFLPPSGPPRARRRRG